MAAQIMAPTTQQALMPRMIVARQPMTISVAQTECQRLMKLLSTLGTQDSYGLCQKKDDPDTFNPYGTAPCVAVYVNYAGSPWQKEVQASLASVQAAQGAAETKKLFGCLVKGASDMSMLSADEVNTALAILYPTTTGAPSSTAKAITAGIVSAEVATDITAGTPALLPGEDCPTGYYRQDPAGPCEMLPPIPNGMMTPPGQIDPSEQLCIEDGGTWDAENYNCILPTERGECRIMGMKCSTAAIVGVAVAGGGLLLFMASKRRKRK